MMQRKRAIADDVDVHLVELAEAALLWALAAPDLLDLVALEGEVENARVVQDVAGEGDREVEVQAQLPGGVGGIGSADACAGSACSRDRR